MSKSLKSNAYGLSKIIKNYIKEGQKVSTVMSVIPIVDHDEVGHLGGKGGLALGSNETSASSISA